MKKLVEILNYLKNRKINIHSLSYDESTETTLIFMKFNNEQKLIEISENKFCFFNEKQTCFNYTLEQIITFLDEQL